MLDKLLRVLLKPKKPLTVKEKLDSVLPPLRTFVKYTGPVNAENTVEISTDRKVCRMPFSSSAFTSFSDWQEVKEGGRLRIWPGKIVDKEWRRVDAVKVGNYAYWWADYRFPEHGEGTERWGHQGKYAPTAKEALNVR